MKFTDISVPIEDDIQAHLLVEVDGNDMDVLFKDCERIAVVMKEYGCGKSCLQIRLAKIAVALAQAVGEAVKSLASIKEDTVVPRAELRNF